MSVSALVPKFPTLFSELSNLLNEHPIGVQPSTDSTINDLTPNNLLLGQATTINPLGWQPIDTNITNWYHLL